MAHEMDFCGLVGSVLAGRKVTRLLWQNADNYVYLSKADQLWIYTDKEHIWVVSKEDLEATDWIELDE